MSFAVFEAVKAVDFHLRENEVLAFRLKRGEKSLEILESCTEAKCNGENESRFSQS